MIPIRDQNPTHRTPVVTYGIIALNVAIFLFGRFLAPSETAFVGEWGMVPARLGALLAGEPKAEVLALLTPLSSMFLHGGWMHLIGNMWFLHVFGDNLEDVLGRSRYLAFYLLTGLGAAAAQGMISPTSTIPMVGASGAISGILGGYVLLYPRAKVVTGIPIVFFIHLTVLPAFVFVGVWFAIQLGSAFFLGGAGGGVAWFAHVGGFLAGILLIRPFFGDGPRGPGHRAAGYEGTRARKPRAPRVYV